MHSIQCSFEALTFYRGTSERYSPRTPYIANVRKDRRPLNSNFDAHAVADRWMLDSFGIRFRSSALFVTSNLRAATHYASTPNHVARIIPIDQYTICWSPIVSDMLSISEFLDFQSESSLRSALDKCQYRTGELASACESGNEVMLSCERYVGIPIACIDVLPANDPQLILPA